MIRNSHIWNLECSPWTLTQESNPVLLPTHHPQLWPCVIELSSTFFHILRKSTSPKLHSNCMACCAWNGNNCSNTNTSTQSDTNTTTVSGQALRVFLLCRRKVGLKLSWHCSSADWALHHRTFSSNVRMEIDTGRGELSETDPFPFQSKCTHVNSSFSQYSLWVIPQPLGASCRPGSR